MKIISINQGLSDKRKVAFRTDPQIDAALFDHIKRLLPQAPTLRGVGMELAEGYLVVNHSSFTPELAKNVNALLNAAAEALRQAQEDVRKRAEQEQAERLTAIQSAASAFGVPIE